MHDIHVIKAMNADPDKHRADAAATAPITLTSRERLMISRALVFWRRALVFWRNDLLADEAQALIDKLGSTD